MGWDGTGWGMDGRREGGDGERDGEVRAETHVSAQVGEQKWRTLRFLRIGYLGLGTDR